MPASPIEIIATAQSLLAFIALTVSATVSEIDGDHISITLSATSAGVKVLGMAKAVVIK